MLTLMWGPKWSVPLLCKNKQNNWLHALALQKPKRQLPRSPRCVLLPRTISAWNQRTAALPSIAPPRPRPAGHTSPCPFASLLRTKGHNRAFFDWLPSNTAVPREVTLMAFHYGVINCCPRAEGQQQAAAWSDRYR